MITKKLLYKICCVSLLTILTVFTLFSQTKSTKRIVRVGWYDTAIPAEEILNGDGRGYYFEYLQALSQYTNWEYEYVLCSWTECLEKLQKGEIDIVGFANKTEERKLIFGFSEIPMGISSSTLITLSNNTKLEFNNFETFKGIKVGNIEGSLSKNEFIKYEKENNFYTTIYDYNTVQDINAALEKGEIDAAIINDEDLVGTEKILATFSPQNQYFITTKSNTEFLKELNRTMTQVNTFFPYLINELRTKYFGFLTNGKPLFSNEEQEFIKKNRNILVMYDANWPPVEYWDEEKGEYAGIVPDVFKKLSEKSGLNFIPEGTTSEQILTEFAETNPENKVTSISYDYIWAERHNVHITQPFISSKIVRFGKNVEAEDGAIVAVNQKAFFTFAMKDDLKGKETLHFSKQIERINAVNNEEADFTYVTLDQASYYQTFPKFRKLKIKEMPGCEQKVCISVSKNSSPIFMSIISKSINSISHDEMNEIIRYNTEITHKSTFIDLFYLYPIRFILILVFVLLAILVTGVYVSINKYKRIESEKASQSKSMFLSRMSHEIRTPLNGVIGMSNLALEVENLPDKAHEYMTNVIYSGKYLLAIINDILDMSKIESGKMKLNIVAARIDDLLQYTIPITKELVKIRSIKFNYSIEKNSDTFIQIDVQHTAQIIVNILSNAVKYTPSGGSVDFNLKSEKLDNGKIRHTYTISDTGIGMTKEFQEKMFSPFTQESRREALQEKGTGLGLSIVKTLIDLMHGSIYVQSEVNKGSTFIIVIDFDESTKDESKESMLEESTHTYFDFKGIHVLLCEDNQMNAEVVSLQLEKKGIIVDWATNGQVAIEKFNASDLHYYSLILMDVHMPVMGGIEATKKIRVLERADAAKIPIIALTADAFDEDVQRVIDAGMNTHLAKPIDSKQLFDVLADQLRKQVMN